MNPEQLQRVESLFHAASELPPDLRGAFLKASCGEDEALLLQVTALLAQDVSQSPMDRPLSELARSLLAGCAAPLWASGAMVGPYRIDRRLGEGGMGDVYLARDTRLDRDVAIKIAKQEFSGRFQREARAISALNHPNICTLYDVGPDYLVMEYIEGSPLAGPVPVARSLALASQIAAAVCHAHQHGVIHRDLKPANILVTRAGVKVLDFGLAKFCRAEDDERALDLTQSAVTSPGVIVGTLRYMAPEQLKGNVADARSDIFAFGAILHELLTGHPAFDGESQANLIASILTVEAPPVRNLQPDVPAALDRLIRICLAKAPEARRQSMQDVLQDLDWIAQEGGHAAHASPQPPKWNRREIIAWSAAATATAASGLLFLRKRPVPHQPVSFQQFVPPGAWMWGDRPAVTPDGRSFVYCIGRPGPAQPLWLRRFDRLEVTPLPGTEEAIYPFWSPDGRFVGFFAHGKLKTVDTRGGTPRTICDAASPRGGTWNGDGVILFGTANGPIHLVAVSGGVPKPVHALDQARQELRQTWPHFLPDGRHFLYSSSDAQRGGVYAATLGSREAKRVLDAPANVHWVAPSFLLFGRGRALVAQHFDAGRLELQGEPVTVADRVAVAAFPDLNSVYSSSPNGTLVYWPETVPNPELEMVWYNRGGQRTGLVGGRKRYRQFTLSPDEKRAAAQIQNSEAGISDLWLIDLAGGIASRLAADDSNKDTVVWSPDGREVFFSSGRSGEMRLSRKVVGAPTAQAVLASGQSYYPAQWLADGSLLFMNGNGRTLFRLGPAADARPESLLSSTHNKDCLRVSPDGRWVVYSSDESGRWEVYLASFPSFTNQSQVSDNGGSQGCWRKDGRELFYLSNEGDLMAVAVSVGARLETGLPRALFRTKVPMGAQLDQFAATGDGQRFLVLEDPTGQARPFTVVLDWPAAIQAS